jgi:hypothetical protein
MLRKTLRSLSIICAGAAMMVTAPAHAVTYIQYFDGSVIVGAEAWDDNGNYCGLWGYRTGIYNVYQSPPGLGIGCP